MREKEIEGKLVKAARRMGGICPKWVSPGLDGMPDRMVLLPGGGIGFVEVKAPGKRPRPLQRARHGRLRELGFLVFVLDDPGQIGGILDAIRTTCVPEVRGGVYPKSCGGGCLSGMRAGEDGDHADGGDGSAV